MPWYVYYTMASILEQNFCTQNNSYLRMERVFNK